MERFEAKRIPRPHQDGDRLRWIIHSAGSTILQVGDMEAAADHYAAQKQKEEAEAFVPPASFRTPEEHIILGEN